MMKTRQICTILLALGLAPLTLASSATYRLTVVNDWTESSFPLGYPDEAHFSWLGGGVHRTDQSFWEFGGIASPGMEEMAETGYTLMLADEIDEADGRSIQYQHWFCQPEGTDPRCGSLVEEFTTTQLRPAVTLVSMLGPSPDFFVGVSGLELLDAQGNWKQTIVVPLSLYDGGTEEGITTGMDNPPTVPFAPISYVEYEPISGNYLPAASAMTVGTFVFELIDEFPTPDVDSDGVEDDTDNCTLIANAAQRDTDADGFGNFCDPDFNNDGSVNFVDFSQLVGLFGTVVGDSVYDLNGDGAVNFLDIQIFSLYFNGPPGPSGQVP